MLGMLMRPPGLPSLQSGYVICADCDGPVVATVNGECSRCGSAAVMRIGAVRSLAAWIWRREG